MSPAENLETLLRELPGIGPRQAKRFVYFLLRQNPKYLDTLARLIASLKTDNISCTSCRRYFPRKEHTGNTCPTCNDQNRDRAILMVVPTDTDFLRIEESGIFKGYYFVLGDTVSVTQKEPEKAIHIRELLRRVEHLMPTLKEVILVSDLTPDGDATTEVVAKSLAPYLAKGVIISHLGRGLSTGSEIEYADTETLRSALENRVPQDF